jgi:uncharacterized protein
VAEGLGGAWLEEPTGSCLVVDRDYAGGFPHGSGRVDDYAAAAVQCRQGLDLLSATGRERASDGQSADGSERMLFFDLETTGLSGGTGTYAFLVGCGYFEAGRFRTRQFFLTGYAEERGLLMAVARSLEPTSLLVTFNGKSFDVPLIGMRYLFHRMESPFDALPHLDLLHPARRLWRRRGEADEALPGGWGNQPGRARANSSCALGALEREILGVERENDVPSAEIPARYFEYARSGDPRPLAAVLEHNRLDLLSLAALTSTVLGLIDRGPRSARNFRECLALGGLYERAGQMSRATGCYAHAAGLGREAGAGRDPDVEVQKEALRRLAVRLRRERRHEEAAEAWGRILLLGGGHLPVEREAAEALAIYHEHRTRDLAAAHRWARRALSGETSLAAGAPVQRRLARLERKLAEQGRRPTGDPPEE